MNNVGITQDIGKGYTRVAWTSPNTSGVISPLMALNDDPLFKRLLSSSDEFKIYSVRAAAFTSAPSSGAIQHIVTFADRNAMEDELTPTLVNSYGSAKHTVINSNGQSVVYWTPLQANGTVEGVTWGKQSQASLEGELPQGAFNPILGIQYQDITVSETSVVSNITVRLIVKVAFKGQRLSKFDLCPVQEDTILTSWGGPISDYNKGPTSLIVPDGQSLYIITKYPTHNIYGYLRNRSGSSKPVSLPSFDSLRLMVPNTSNVMVTNHGEFGYFNDYNDTDGFSTSVTIYHDFLKL